MNWFTTSTVQEVTVLDAVRAKENGTLKLPLYQRDAVWGEGRICALWDSLLRGYPLPSFLLVQGKGISRSFQHHSLGSRGKSVEDIGVYYELLDGQQRMDAISSVFNFHSGSTLRLWVDLAPKKETFPFKFKYGLYACNKVFPFGFRMEADGERDFAVLSDRDTLEIWNRLQKNHAELRGKEFYDLPLDKTYPYKAGCPIPLDKLAGLVSSSEMISSHLIDSIYQLAERYKQESSVWLEDPQEPAEKIVQRVANGISRLPKYKIVLQLVEPDKSEEDDYYTLFERIGTGGMQISPRQLAVSKLMLSLGKVGNDAIASFQNSKELQHLQGTEDVVHGLARVAFAVSDIGARDDNETEEVRNKRDLLELSPERLRVMQRDTKRWADFISVLKGYCEPISNENSATPLQKAFKQMYEDLRFVVNENPNGFSLLQLAQPDRRHEGISPITLHPLLFWYLTSSEGPYQKPEHREEMLRWVLFANGFTSNPTHAKFNRETFRLVQRIKRIDFAKIARFVFSNENLRKELGFFWNNEPVVSEKGEIVQQEHDFADVPSPESITKLLVQRLLLQNWADSKVNRFILLWNQREAMEHFYGTIEYRPALFSKGRPIDADHIVARSRLLYEKGTSIKDTHIRDGFLSILNSNDEILPLTSLNTFVFNNIVKLSADCFRKNFPNLTANYRYWPKRLNRHDNNKTVLEKFDLEHLREGIANHPLEDKFNLEDLDSSIWKWSAVPIEDKEIWSQLPPNEGPWNHECIGKFFLAILKREYFLYKSAYQFIKAL